jgi:hypothetical protein
MYHRPPSALLTDMTTTQGGSMNLNLCTEAHCNRQREGLGLCARHLFRWALRCHHGVHGPRQVAA